MLNSAPASPPVPTASHPCLPWLGVCLCVSSTWGRTPFPPSLSCAICVRWHVSGCCVWLKIPAVEQIPVGIACLCCAACLDCRSLTTKVSPREAENSPQRLLKLNFVDSYVFGLFGFSRDRGGACHGSCGRWSCHYPTRQSQKSASIQPITWRRHGKWPPTLQYEGDQVIFADWHTWEQL